VFELHQRGEVPTNTYVVDLDAVKLNARTIADAARSADINNYFMTKQFGRNPLISKAIMDAGIQSAAAIDIEETKALHRNGVKVDHVGHLVQIPKADVYFVVREVCPEIITVYSYEKARRLTRPQGN
jgi:predicted amino acid racemase